MADGAFDHEGYIDDLCKKLGVPRRVFGYTNNSSNIVWRIDNIQETIKKMGDLLQKKHEEMLKREQERQARNMFPLYFNFFLNCLLHENAAARPSAMDEFEWRDRFIERLDQTLRNRDALRRDLRPEAGFAINDYRNALERVMNTSCPVCAKPYKKSDTGTEFSNGILQRAWELCHNCGLYTYDIVNGGVTVNSIYLEIVGFAELHNVREIRDKEGDVHTLRHMKRYEFLKEARAMYRDVRCKPFLAAIQANQFDHAPRLVFADFLEENGIYPLQSKAIRDWYKRTVASKKEPER